MPDHRFSRTMMSHSYESLVLQSSRILGEMTEEKKSSRRVMAPRSQANERGRYVDIWAEKYSSFHEATPIKSDAKISTNKSLVDNV